MDKTVILDRSREEIHEALVERLQDDGDVGKTVMLSASDLKEQDIPPVEKSPAPDQPVDSPTCSPKSESGALGADIDEGDVASTVVLAPSEPGPAAESRGDETDFLEQTVILDPRGLPEKADSFPASVDSSGESEDELDKTVILHPDETDKRK